MIVWIKKNQDTLFTSIIFLFCLSLFILTANNQALSNDIFWHLRMGLDLIEKGLSPFKDHYSYTFAQQPITDVPYLFQATLAFFVSIFGLQDGLLALRLFASSLLLFAVYTLFRQIKTPWPVIVLVLPFITFFMSMRLFARPEVFDYPLIVFALILYIKANESFSNRNLSYIALLLLFWANYHTAILGYIIFFGLFLDKAIEIVTKQNEALSWQRWLGWGIIIFLIGFLNPDFKHTLFSILENTSRWSTLIQEFTPTNTVNDYEYFFVYWLLSIYLVIFLLKQKQYGFAFICALFAFKSWEISRLITAYGIITFSLLAYSLTQINFIEFFSNISTSIKKIILTFWLAASILGIFMASSVALQTHLSAKKIPEITVKYLINTYPEGGNIFNHYNTGAYLTYALTSDFKIYIDGRSNILYSFDFTKEALDIFSNFSSDLLIKKIDQYNIEYAITPLERSIFLLMHRSKKMNVDFVGDEFVLYSTKQNNFPVSTALLLFPMCWDEKQQLALSSEITKGKQILPPNSTLAPILESLDKLSQNNNFDEFMSSLDLEQASNEHIRLLAFIALKSGAYGHAFKLFERIYTDKEYLDILMMIYTAINAKVYSEAETLLFLTSDVWPELLKKQPSMNQKVLIINLYENLKKHHAIQEKSKQYLNKLKKELEQVDYSDTIPLSHIIPQGYCHELLP